MFECWHLKFLISMINPQRHTVNDGIHRYLMSWFWPDYGESSLRGILHFYWLRSARIVSIVPLHGANVV